MHGWSGTGAALRRTGGQRAAVAVHQRHGRRSAGQAHRVRLSFRLLLRHARLRPARPRAERPAARALFDGRLCRRRRWVIEWAGWEQVGVLGISFGGMGRPGAGAPTPGARRPPRPRLHVERGAGGSSYPLHELAGLDRAESAERELALVDTRWADPGFEDPLRALFAQRVASAPPRAPATCSSSKHAPTTTRGNGCPRCAAGPRLRGRFDALPRGERPRPRRTHPRCPARRVRRRPCLHRPRPLRHRRDRRVPAGARLGGEVEAGAAGGAPVAGSMAPDEIPSSPGRPGTSARRSSLGGCPVRHAHRRAAQHERDQRGHEGTEQRSDR